MMPGFDGLVGATAAAGHTYDIFPRDAGGAVQDQFADAWRRLVAGVDIDRAGFDTGVTESTTR